MYERKITGKKFGKIEDVVDSCLFKKECGAEADCDGCREFCRTNPEDAVAYFGLTLVKDEGI